MTALSNILNEATVNRATSSAGRVVVSRIVIEIVSEPVALSLSVTVTLKLADVSACTSGAINEIDAV